MFLSELRQCAGYGFARRSDNLGDLLMRECDLDSHPLGIRPVAVRPLKKKARQSFRRGVRKSERTYLLVCRLAVAAQMLCRFQAGIAMYLEESQEVIPLDEIKLAGLAGLCGDFVWSTGDRGMQSEYLTGLGDLQDQGFAVSRGRGEFNAPFAQHVDTTRRLAFHEKDSAGRIRRSKLYFLKTFERGFGKAAKETVSPKFADEAVFDKF